MNQQAGPNPYLRTKIMTASSEELRLMLYDGAIKFCNQAKQAIAANNYEDSYNNLSRAQKIVLELSTSLNHQIEPEVTEKMASLHNYIYRRLVDANMNREIEAIDEAIKLIQYERETWQMLMKKVHGLQGVPESDGTSGEKPASNPAAGYGELTKAQQTAISSYSQSA
ncbi:flagellar export chaperone FliS [Poriferisphaera sp. WC338]|uniref:flagellar export chaperone FliS n=1 Tax=Poriferisphaera sp. WC338 TaxID=3425129 RepID=UPI003D81B0C6